MRVNFALALLPFRLALAALTAAASSTRRGARRVRAGLDAGMSTAEYAVDILKTVALLAPGNRA